MPKRTLILIIASLCLSQAYSQTKGEIYDLEVISVYQLADNDNAGFDFQVSNRKHTCGSKGASNHYRSISTNSEVSKRKFQLVLTALQHGYRLSLKEKRCLGKRMLVDWIRVSR